MQGQNFQILVNAVPYFIKAEPFEFNADTRYKVSFNGSDDYIFTHDADIGRYRAINDDASTLPDDVENAIADRLQALQ